MGNYFKSKEERLKAYEERFGDINSYSDDRLMSEEDVSVSVMTFAKAVRDLAKRHTYLTHYQGTLSRLDKVTKQEYDEAVQALSELASRFDYAPDDPEVVDTEKL